MSSRIIQSKDGFRFLYAGPYKTRERAEMSLEDMYANGDVCESERPKIEHVHKRYWVSVPANL